MPVPPGPAVAPRTSVYARSRLFRWGVWMLLIAGVLFAWSGFKQSRVAGAGDLKTVNGTFVEYKSQPTSQRYPGGGSGRRFRGSTGSVNILRIELPDGAVTEFSSHTWVRPPRNGWRRGQPIRVRHDGLRDLYEVVVAGETLQDVATTQRLRAKESRGPQPFAVLFLLAGLTCTVVGFALSLGQSRTPAAMPSAAPPLPPSPAPAPSPPLPPPPLPRT